jgi:hypothetical protein
MPPTVYKFGIRQIGTVYYLTIFTRQTLGIIRVSDHVSQEKSGAHGKECDDDQPSDAHVFLLNLKVLAQW